MFSLSSRLSDYSTEFAFFIGVFDINENLIKEEYTKEDGVFEINDLPYGKYQVYIEVIDVSGNKIKIETDDKEKTKQRLMELKH